MCDNLGDKLIFACLAGNRNEILVAPPLTLTACKAAMPGGIKSKILVFIFGPKLNNDPNILKQYFVRFLTRTLRSVQKLWDDFLALLDLPPLILCDLFMTPPPPPQKRSHNFWTTLDAN